MRRASTAEVLTGLMAAFGVGPTELSKKTGVNQSTISRIKQGKIREPRDIHANALAGFFGVTVDQLRGRVAIDWSKYEGVNNLRLVGDILSSPQGRRLMESISSLVSKGVPEWEAMETAITVLHRLDSVLTAVKRS